MKQKKMAKQLYVKFLAAILLVGALGAIASASGHYEYKEGARVLASLKQPTNSYAYDVSASVATTAATTVAIGVATKALPI